MSCLMSLIITFVNVGMIDGVILIWLKAWALSFVIAYPVVLTVTPVVNKLVKRVIRE